jgi:hypothetical protein
VEDGDKEKGIKGLKEWSQEAKSFKDRDRKECPPKWSELITFLYNFFGPH